MSDIPIHCRAVSVHTELNNLQQKFNELASDMQVQSWKGNTKDLDFHTLGLTVNTSLNAVIQHSQIMKNQLVADFKAKNKRKCTETLTAPSPVKKVATSFLIKSTQPTTPPSSTCPSPKPATLTPSKEKTASTAKVTTASMTTLNAKVASPMKQVTTASMTTLNAKVASPMKQEPVPSTSAMTSTPKLTIAIKQEDTKTQKMDIWDDSLDDSILSQASQDLFDTSMEDSQSTQKNSQDTDSKKEPSNDKEETEDKGADNDKEEEGTDNEGADNDKEGNQETDDKGTDNDKEEKDNNKEDGEQSHQSA